MSDTADFAADRVIVMAAPNGARRTKEEHPAVPVTAEEIAREAEKLLDAGASILHLHVRDAEGRHSLDVDRYRAATGAVRERIGDGMIIQATTEAVGRYSPDEQMAVVRELQPEAVSLGLRELCADEAQEAVAGPFFASLRPAGIWPQYILYSPDDVRRFDALRRKGFFGEESPFCLLVLGRYSDALEGSVAELDAMLDAVDPTAFPWAACCFGRREQAAMLAAVRAGGHVRLGFENNLLLADGTPAGDNSALIRQFIDASASTGRMPARADEIRAAFRI